jgi:acetyl esterase/lipase
MIHYPLLLLLSVPALAAEPAVKRDLEYARVGEHSLKLDLYLPKGVKGPPLIVWVHGGGWRSGSKSQVPVQKLVDDVWAIASVDYRLSPVARFPAQVHDIKAAIRFLRAKAKDHGYDAGKVVVAGASAGGHLAALVGVSGGVKELEGAVGEHLKESSDVQAIVSYYGASNLETILAQSTPHGLKVRVPALELLLGGPPEEKGELARLASPVAHVDDKDPPLLLLHGDQDPQMPINQSHELHGKYKEANRPVEFVVIHGGVHGGAGFYEPAMLMRVRTFIERHVQTSSK